MFTGLVQAIGTVVAADPTPSGRRLVIDPAGWPHTPEPGASICISGCCLSTVGPRSEFGGRLAFDAVPETLAKTTLGSVRPGRRVNLEHSVTASTLMGGHFVQGHVDGVGTVDRVVTDDGWRLRVRPPAELVPFVIPKGSICLDGISLTVAAQEPDPAAGGPWFEVAIIPETLERTTIGDLRPGDGVNLEGDMLVKSVVHTIHLTGLAGRGGGAAT